MRGFWRARQKSVGCISPHTWKLPLVMAVCILVYSLPLSLAVSVEQSSEPRADEAPHNEWKRQQPDEINTTTASDTTGTPGGPSDAIVIGIPTILVSLLGIIVTAVVTVWGVWYANKKKKGNDPSSGSIGDKLCTSSSAGPATTPAVPPTTSTVPATTPTVPPTSSTVPPTTPAVSSLTLSAIDEPCIKMYVRSLKSKYRQKQITDDKTWRGSTSPRYINLTVVRQHNIDKSERGRSTKMLGNIGNILTKKIELLDLKDLDQLEDGSKAKCVLVQGAPGVGKTTMAQELCRQWAEEQLFKHYSLLVLLKLRNKSVQSIKEKKNLFLHSSDPSAVASIVEKYTETETAFLLDGFDELPQEMQMNSVFVNLITKEIFPDACVIITSRPSVIDILCKHCGEQLNYLHVEVLGFTEEQRISFVDTWFDENVEESSRAAERRQFESYLELHPHIRALMYIPLNCSIVIDVYQSSKASGDSIVPTTQTELYRQNTLTILNRYRPEKRKPQNLQDIPPEDRENLQKVSKLAYDGIATLPQKLIFQEKEIPQDPTGKNGMGFMDTDYDERSESYSYNFLHLTIQEFLAAYHISTLDAAEQVQKIEDSLDKRHLEIVLRFFAGLTKFQSSDRSITPRDWLQTYYKSGSILECLRWMFEAQDKELLRQVLGDGTQDLHLSDQTLSPFDCYILGYCIAKSDCQWKLKCRLGEEGMKMLSRGSEGCLRNVQVINLSWSDLKVGVQHLASVLRENTGLTELRLQNCGIDAEGISHLAQALCVNTTLTVLDLSWNTVDSQGAEHLSSLLKKNTGLTELRLLGCSIDAEGTSHLVQALCVNTTLRVLDLSHNSVDSQDAEHLALILEKTCSLTELSLFGCNIGEDGACRLARAIHANSTLKKLVLWNNPLGERGAKELVESLAHNTTIEELYLPRQYKDTIRNSVVEYDKFSERVHWR